MYHLLGRVHVPEVVIDRPLPPLPDLDVSEEAFSTVVGVLCVWINLALFVARDIAIRGDLKVLLQVENEKVMIPRNSLIEVNQSGLLMETMIDITARDSIPRPAVGPLDAECDKEGLIVCDKQKIEGIEGVSLDAFIGILTRLGCEVEDVGVTNTYALGVQATSIIEEARLLFSKMKDITEDIQHLLAEVRGRGLLKEIEKLTKSLTQTSEELRKVKSSIVTPENVDLIRNSIHSLIFTLKKLEVISSDIAGFTGDEATRHKLKLLIKSLSRML